ncbi:MAG: hypothetical protein ACK4IT_03055 [Thioalkalivibrionaceae bacterium]
MTELDNDDYRPPLADYWDSLETIHGPGFRIESLTHEERATLIDHLRDAVERDRRVTRVEKTNLKIVLDHAQRVQSRSSQS